MHRKIYYKVVTKDRLSRCIGGSFELKYEKGIKTYAWAGSIGILVFDTYAAASTFSSSFFNPGLILQCHGHGWARRPKQLIYSRADNLKWLRNIKKAPSRILKLTPPEGTVAFEAITCLE